jgi:CopG family nickel-responsive transcriptional regulator
MDEKGVTRFSVSTPPKLLHEFDQVITKMNYERSKAIRLAMQNFLTEYQWTSGDGTTGVGALIMIYDHETKGLEETLTEIQHEYRKLITSTTHIHLDDQHCLEILAIQGEVKNLQNLTQTLLRERGVKQLKLATLSL